ncbi:MAG: DUF1932 domain-containing protein [Blastomonas sp.]|nr:DUF1932 domain-containing protein [Blastomonas sp.]
MPVATFIGFGEAGRAFAWPGARAFDRQTYDAGSRDAMLAAYAAAQAEGAGDAQSALAGADVALSLVTADQALPAARDCAPLLDAGAMWLDMNSVAPGTKRRAAEAIEAAGGRYVDVAVMAPVLPARRSVPLLVAGPHAEAAAMMLARLDFSNVTIAGPNIGDASAIKMIRSVMVKGIEALTAEFILAADRAGVSEAVLSSLDASWKPQGWSERVDYNLDRMMAHGLRRAAEMEEVAKTLKELGISPVMSEATLSWQQRIGDLRIDPPEGLNAKLAAIKARREELAA